MAARRLPSLVPLVALVALVALAAAATSLRGLCAEEPAAPVPRAPDPRAPEAPRPAAPWDLVRVSAAEDAWRDVGWLPSFGDAVALAREQGRPIFLWAMNGHPLGCV